MSVKCKSCGSELPAQTKFCTQCGVVVSVAHSSATENLLESTQPLMTEEKDYTTNVYTLPPDATEILSPPPQAKTGKTTQELAPATGAPGRQSKTGAGTHPKTSAPQHSVPTAAATTKSGRRLPLVISVAVLLLAAVVVAGVYVLRVQTSNSPETADSTSTSFSSPAASVDSSPTSNVSSQIESDSMKKAPEAAPGEKEKNEKKQVAGKQDVEANTKTDAPTPVSAITTATAPKEIPKEEPKTGTANPAKSTSPSAKEAAPTEQPKITAAEFLQRGLNAQNSGRHQEALGEFRKALQQDPSNVGIYYLIGSSHHRLGQLEQALAAYRQCTSGAYARVSSEHVKTLEKKVGKSKY